MASNSRKHVRNAAEHGERAVKAVRREATAAGREALNGMSEQMHEVFDAGRAQVTDLAECARDSIRARPLQTLAMAVGAGVVFGLTMRLVNRWR
ncbi:MAG TPA: hypothetical protein VHD36_18420 [Pirellulales bacterium]|nr:hypothetical protein [Pirellulales bacterium]